MSAFIAAVNILYGYLFRPLKWNGRVISMPPRKIDKNKARKSRCAPADKKQGAEKDVPPQAKIVL